MTWLSSLNECEHLSYTGRGQRCVSREKDISNSFKLFWGVYIRICQNKMHGFGASTRRIRWFSCSSTNTFLYLWSGSSASLWKLRFKGISLHYLVLLFSSQAQLILVELWCFCRCLHSAHVRCRAMLSDGIYCSFPDCLSVTVSNFQHVTKMLPHKQFKSGKAIFNANILRLWTILVCQWHGGCSCLGSCPFCFFFSWVSARLNAARHIATPHRS